jgi:FkbM family methyltransferase
MQQQRSDIKLVGGLWLPAHEMHLIGWMNHPKNRVVIDGRLAYQWKKQQLAMAHVKQWRTAVDVGGHCGLWSMHLVRRFQHVHAFEPVALHRECFECNVAPQFIDVTTLQDKDTVLSPGEKNFTLYPCALGEVDGKCSMHTTPSSSGDSFVSGAGDIPIRRLDDFDLQDVDFIKLDCEGYELLALKGGEQTLKRCRPTIIVEQKPGRAQKFGLPESGAVDYLESLGAQLLAVRSGDYVMAWT